jgi:hypothetical protein
LPLLSARRPLPLCFGARALARRLLSLGGHDDDDFLQAGSNNNL